MLNKLNRIKMVWRLVVVALLLGLYYLLPIHEGLTDRKRKTSTPVAPSISMIDKVKSLREPRTQRPPRRKNS
jgi:hypothetical protein